MSVVLYCGLFLRCLKRLVMMKLYSKFLLMLILMRTSLWWTELKSCLFWSCISIRSQRLGQRNCPCAAKFCWPIFTCAATFFIILLQSVCALSVQCFAVHWVSSSAKTKQGNFPTTALFFRNPLSVSNVVYSVFGLVPTEEAMGPMCTWIACLCSCSYLTRSLLY